MNVDVCIYERMNVGMYEGSLSETSSAQYICREIWKFVEKRKSLRGRRRGLYTLYPYGCVEGSECEAA